MKNNSKTGRIILLGAAGNYILTFVQYPLLSILLIAVLLGIIGLTLFIAYVYYSIAYKKAPLYELAFYSFIYNSILVGVIMAFGSDDGEETLMEALPYPVINIILFILLIVIELMHQNKKSGKQMYQFGRPCNDANKHHPSPVERGRGRGHKENQIKN